MIVLNLKTNLTVIHTLTSAELRGRYRNTIAGFLWVALNPIIMFSVHALVFKYILKIDTDQYFIFLLSGLLPWIFISQNLSMTCNCFITNRDLLLSFQINPVFVLLSKVIDNFINFLFPFFLLFIFLSFSQDFHIEGLMLIPINILLLLIGSFGLSLITAVAQIYLRDTQYILNFVLSILYFVTPIFYPEKMVPEFLRFLLKINPVYLIIKPFQVSLWNFSPGAYIEALTSSCFAVAIISIVAAYTWKRKKDELYLNI